MIYILFIRYIFTEIASPFDKDLKTTQNEITGFLKDHDKTINLKSLGSFALVTYNMEKKESLDAENQVIQLARLLDTTHIPLITLQEITADQIDELKAHILPHYDLVSDKKSKVIDATTGAETYLPIVYDTKTVEVVKDGVFQNAGIPIKNTYASWASFKFKKHSVYFTVININLFSTRALVDSTELSSILVDIERTPDIKNNIIFIMGTINGVSDDTKILIEKKFVKLSNFEERENEQKNTLNTLSDVKNNTERDFILALDLTGRNLSIVPAYSKVLSLFEYGARFPIHAIFNFTT